MKKSSIYLVFIASLLGSGLIVAAHVELICINPEARNAKNNIFLLLHGVDPRSGACIKQSQHYITTGIIEGLCYTFNFQDSITTVNFGQEDDCEKLVQALTQLGKYHPKANIILVGISRGASTILNTLATRQELNWHNVKGIILESPYGHMNDVVDHIASNYVFFIPFSKVMLQALVNGLPNYNPGGMQAIELVTKIKPAIPLFIGFTKQDKTVPPQSTIALIRLLETHTHTVEVCAAEEGHHSTLAQNSNYISATQSFLNTIS